MAAKGQAPRRLTDAVLTDPTTAELAIAARRETIHRSETHRGCVVETRRECAVAGAVIDHISLSVPLTLADEPVPGRVWPAAADQNRRANVGKPWDLQQDRMLLALFDKGLPLAEIAEQMARTVSGARARLEKHGRLEPLPGSRRPSWVAS